MIEPILRRGDKCVNFRLGLGSNRAENALKLRVSPRPVLREVSYITDIFCLYCVIFPLSVVVCCRHFCLHSCIGDKLGKRKSRTLST